MAKQFVFGSGSAYATNTVANSSPSRFAALQGLSIDYQFNLKQLYGQKNFPLTVARSAGKITGKAMSASFQARQMNDIFFGNTLTAGEQRTAVDEGPTAIPVTPFTITVTNSATFLTDLGVINSATGQAFVRVASAPTAGQYSVNVATGVYTFAGADNVSAISVKISYTWTSAATGQKIQIVQSLMGVAPTFSLVLNQVYAGLQLNVILNSCVATKLAFASKTEDFSIPDFEFEAYADAGDNIGYLSFANIGD